MAEALVCDTRKTGRADIHQTSLLVVTVTTSRAVVDERQFWLRGAVSEFLESPSFFPVYFSVCKYATI